MAYLPEELLQNTFRNLQPTLPEAYWEAVYPENNICYNTFAAICRVSRACSRIATPLLYRAIDLSRSPEDAYYTSSRSIWFRLVTTFKLLRTFLQRPELVLEIRALRTRQSYPRLSAKGTPPPEGPNHKQTLGLPHGPYEPVLQDMLISTDLRLALLRGVQSLYGDALLAVLVFIAPNIEHLQDAPASQFFARTQQELAASKLQRPFKLHTLDLRGGDAPNAWRTPLYPKHLHRWFRCLPMLHTVRLFNLHVDRVMNERCASVVRVELFQGGCSDRSMACLLQCFPNLRELSITLIGISLRRYQNQDAVFFPCPSRLADALCEHSQRLEKLHCVVSRTGANMKNNRSLCEVLPRPIGDLRPLSQLRELTVTGSALLGEDSIYSVPFRGPRTLVLTLPPSLEKFRIVEDAQALGMQWPHEELDRPKPHLQYRRWELLHEQVWNFCLDERFESLRCVELDPCDEAYEGGFVCSGWQTVCKNGKAILTRA